MTKACANERRELAFLIVLCVQIAVVLSQGKPIYNIAHMVNTISEVKKYLDKGANGIETDVTFLLNGTARWAHHGFPCDCFRNCDQYQDIVEHLRYIHLVTTSESSSYKNQMTLLFLDLKISDLPANKKIIAGNDIAKKLIENLWQRGRNFLK
ncbi:phospholipase D LiSicTox-betaIA1i-like [Limulus polyphemus]|uniref:Phospholipase D LiSicTox-betaIA1i-like n=1 Tax=Limulus polyphemus TaxID=6850 RepID=A0ABM1BES3_LIMPO|nr:phospholipase D LiSicTox-betaIA1i-like [Limulus polyphemus]